MAALRAAWAALALAGCAAGVPAPPADPAPAAPADGGGAVVPPEPAGTLRLRCDDGTELRVTFAQDEARVAGLQAGEQTLLRDAGGVTPQQSVYSNEMLRAEFGLGADGREADLHELQTQRRLHCVRR